ncbi:hypothetical protein [Riemerella anatipestifer]|uniref:Uncharacterized protein n=1 Tax=Riemerella anatipestifer RA-CH-1 TaxID=1228997 RepID=J9R7X7_RIEAN|nr:hypothetical protein [Riemerella anatipestifer]AFR36583.1 hypothetical protein B739_2001 [Riemerella anatipestifer RA-CH-1]AIH01378.1 hypothetical protein M949_0207 [Riemerella anatipestifer CH3]MCO7331384.1 hypothetical protein [Riemerella anatipestifer]MCO7350145.1 hypothetical protein [Riemerella anatipestifer]MCU7582179.1 hypothetical protein [Riemerella anatipestifer]
MDLQNRVKVAIQLLIGYEIADNQEGIGKLLGYENKSYFSQIINGKVALPKDFLEKLSSLDYRISKKWLIDNIGNIENKQVYISDTEQTPPPVVTEGQSSYSNNTEVELLRKQVALLEENRLLHQEIKQLQEHINRLELENTSIKSKPQDRAAG